MQPYNTRQEVFDKAFAGLKAQDFKQSMMMAGSTAIGCAYTNKEGLHCAVGHLLPKETLEEIRMHISLNELDIKGLMAGRPDVDALFTEIHSDFVQDLQLAHDKEEKDMEKNLRKFAARHDLLVEGAEPFPKGIKNATV